MAHRCTWGEAPFSVTIRGRNPLTVWPRGRSRWALECLVASGPKGCTPIETPGPRWSSYVHKLREMGVAIETVTEAHGGAFSGHHARYVLSCTVTRGPAEVSA